jgi:hypothetical protein
VQEDGNIRRIAGRTFDRLCDGRADKQIREFAGKRIRFAMPFMEARGGKPVHIFRTDYFIVGFDGKGYVDQQERQEMMQLVGALWDPFSAKSEDIVERLQPELAKLKHTDRFRWTPTPEEKTRIEDLALKLW